MNEARVVINGMELTDAEVMALRVAVTIFRAEMKGPNPLGNDATGIAIAAGYARTLRDVERLLAVSR